MRVAAIAGLCLIAAAVAWLILRKDQPGDLRSELGEAAQTYVLREWVEGGQQLPTESDHGPTELRVDPRGLTVSWGPECGPSGGTLRIESDRIMVLSAIQTLGGCPDDVTADLSAFLLDGPTASIEGDRLTLREHDVVLKFDRTGASED